MSLRLLLLFCLLCGAPASRAAVALLTLPEGIVAGTRQDGVSAWFDLPYAAAPVGPLRWRPPQPRPAWDGVRPAVEYGPLCPQDTGIIEGPRPPMSEDCLALNVWTPSTAPAKPLPVIVWLHGGGYFQGGSSQTPTAGWALARRGVVFVSVNFRLGALGFLAHPALSREAAAAGVAPHSGNYGLLDQIAALRWIHDHIALFGGDPGNVTLMGQSSGAVTATTLATLPQARGLFHKLILHSGSVATRLRRLDRPAGDWDSMEALGLKFARVLHADDDQALARLRDIPWPQIERAWRVALAQLQGDGTWHHLGLDGVTLTEVPGAVFAAGRQAPVPVLAGTTADEGSWFARRALLNSRERFDGYVAEVYGADRVAELRKRYAARANSRQEWLDAASRLIGDQFREDLTFLADAQSRVVPQVWIYEFRRERIPPGRFAALGDYHSAELPYVFDQLPPELEKDAWHAALADELADRWVSFASGGTPNPPGRTAWQPWSATIHAVNRAGGPTGVK